MTILQSRRPTIYLETFLCILLFGLFLWKGLIPAWRTLNTDFPNYYLVARLLREGYCLDRIYDWVWLQRIKDHWGLSQSLVGFAGLTPFSALPVVPLTVFSALIAKRIWIVTNLLLLAASVDLLRRSTRLSLRHILALSLLAIVPLRTSFLYGQMHICVLFLLLLAWFFYRRDRDLACGACIALAAGLKVYPLLFVLLFFWKRQWRLVLSVLGATAIMVMVAGQWMGWDILRIYATQVLPRSFQGEVLDPYNLHAASAAVFFHRLFLYEPSLNPTPFSPSPLLYAIVYPLWQAAILLPLFSLIPPATSHRRDEGLEWAAFLLALVVLSPVPSSYHYVVLIFSVVFFVDESLSRHDRKLAAALIVMYTLICTADLRPSPTHLGNFALVTLGFARLWCIIGFYILGIICLRRSRPSQSLRLSSLHAGWLAGFALSLMIFGFLGYQNHFYRRTQELSRRLQSPLAHLLVMPEPFPGGYHAVAMVGNGYRVIDQRGYAVSRAMASSPDQLSFTGNNTGSFIEIADASGSHLVRVAGGSIVESIVSNAAESPSLSSDGETLAFIREEKGRGSLWIMSLTQQQNLHLARPLISNTNYDVRDPSFLGADQIAFLAKHDGRVGIFLTVQDGPPKPWLSLETDIGSFAVSPDEDRLAYTQLVRHRWQLFIMRLRTGKQKQLTFSDCNAYTPAWQSEDAVLYATDCGRGLGLTAISSVVDKKGWD